jgi:hypothetical chaperone protein
LALKVGIDFGTSNSGVAISDGHQVRILPIDQRNLVPQVVKSILYITKDHKFTIGQEAVELYYKHNVNRVRRYVKKRAGEIEYRGADMFYVTDVYVYEDELRPGRLLQYLKTALRTRDYPGSQVFDRYYSLTDFISIYLAELKKRAERLLDDEISAVTLGRPVKFSSNLEKDHSTQETLRQAALQAGFQQVDFEFEPVAAALYYEMSLTYPENVLIFDFGGGTLDITIMRLGDPHTRQVYASGGIGIAGSDFDQAIIQKRLLPHFGKGIVEHDHEILELVNTISDWIALPELSTPRAKRRLEEAIQHGIAPVRLKALQSLIFDDLAFSFYNNVEAAKIALSSQGAALVHLVEKDIDIWELYTRAQFEEDIRIYQNQIEAVLLETVAASGLDTNQIDAVVKTGGSSSIPAFSAILGRIFGPDRLKSSDLFSSVTAGLAIKAQQGNM